MAKQGKLQINIEYLATFIVDGILSRLPISVSMALGRAIALVAHTFATGLRRTGDRNLRLAFPEMSSDERRRIVRGCFRSLGRQLGLFSHFLTDSPAALRQVFDVSGLEYVENS